MSRQETSSTPGPRADKPDCKTRLQIAHVLSTTSEGKEKRRRKRQSRSVYGHRIVCHCPAAVLVRTVSRVCPGSPHLLVSFHIIRHPRHRAGVHTDAVPTVALHTRTFVKLPGAQRSVCRTYEALLERDRRLQSELRRIPMQDTTK